MERITEDLIRCLHGMSREELLDWISEQAKVERVQAVAELESLRTWHQQQMIGQGDDQWGAGEAYASIAAVEEIDRRLAVLRGEERG